MRPLSSDDFNRIITLGLNDSEPLLPRVDEGTSLSGFEEVQAPFAFERPRERVDTLSSRIVRDRIFRRVVLRAYDERCAISGLKLINGGGRAEVAAAHIRPVEANGPDIVSNGLALSGTEHWMFDRGLISSPMICTSSSPGRPMIPTACAPSSTKTAEPLRPAG